MWKMALFTANSSLRVPTTCGRPTGRSQCGNVCKLSYRLLQFFSRAAHGHPTAPPMFLSKLVISSLFVFMCIWIFTVYGSIVIHIISKHLDQRLNKAVTLKFVPKHS